MKKVFSVALFSVAVLLLTKTDHLVNSTLYSYGLNYNPSWHLPYTVLYTLLYLLVVLLLGLYHRDLGLGFVMAVFVAVCGPDLAYFLVWDGGFPSGTWTWMWQYELLGWWTTQTQLLLTFTAITLAGIVALVGKGLRRGVS